MAGLFDKIDGLLDKVIPKNPDCPLTQCTAMKIYMVLAVLSLGSAAVQSWGNFVSTLIFEILVGLLMLWLCRHCHYKWAWTIVILSLLAPIMFFIAFIVGLVMVASGPAK